MEEKNLSAAEMEKQSLANERAFEEDLDKREKEIINHLSSEIEDFTRISKEDNLGF